MSSSPEYWIVVHWRPAVDDVWRLPSAVVRGHIHGRYVFPSKDEALDAARATRFRQLAVLAGHRARLAQARRDLEAAAPAERPLFEWKVDEAARHLAMVDGCVYGVAQVVLSDLLPPLR